MHIIILLVLLCLPIIALSSFFSALGVPKPIADQLAIVLFVGGPIVGLVWYFVWKRKKQREKDLLVDQLIWQHIRALHTTRTQTAPRDAYGNRDTRRWRKEKVYFIETALQPALQEQGYRLERADLSTVLTRIDEWINDFEVSSAHVRSPFYQAIDTLSGLEYEHHCANLLSDAGWTTRVTQASGDQGADVIAEKHGVRVVLQCKKYSQPVGNKAVQQALAAKHFVDAQYAVVVSNNRFTASAVALAEKSGVALVHHSQLEHLEEFL